ncbi:MAG: hypothetical protein OEV12_00780 [Gammaproteobacteria bacterium]|nr:hypothetical protein [Gammaproteobacteria bacterium]MDH3984932.1 hypothetical protein [Gammaproteobacteria bacterium]
MIISGQNIGPSEIKDACWIATASCLNIIDSGAAAACKAEAKDEQKQGWAICKEACGLTGGNRYDPDDAGDTVPVNHCFPRTPCACTEY